MPKNFVNCNHTAVQQKTNGVNMSEGSKNVCYETELDDCLILESMFLPFIGWAW